jgi:metal-responsive CopG/Arc/MetJ family transcriptional regulator
MTAARKIKVSVTISEDLLLTIDHHAKHRDGATRSSVIEEWLRTAAKRKAAEALEHDTVAYYADYSAAARQDDEDWSQVSSEQFESLEID